jgi:hypothetical protein
MVIPNDSGLFGDGGTGAPPDVVVEKSTGDLWPPMKVSGSM